MVSIVIAPGAALPSGLAAIVFVVQGRQQGFEILSRERDDLALSADL